MLGFESSMLSKKHTRSMAMKALIYWDRTSKWGGGFCRMKCNALLTNDVDIRKPADVNIRRAPENSNCQYCPTCLNY